MLLTGYQLAADHVVGIGNKIIREHHTSPNPAIVSTIFSLILFRFRQPHPRPADGGQAQLLRVFRHVLPLPRHDLEIGVFGYSIASGQLADELSVPGRGLVIRLCLLINRHAFAIGSQNGEVEIVQDRLLQLPVQLHQPPPFLFRLLTQLGWRSEIGVAPLGFVVVSGLYFTGGSVFPPVMDDGQLRLSDP